MSANTNERTIKRQSWHVLAEIGNMWQILKDKGIEKAKKNC
jgi:hypothetical protein